MDDIEITPDITGDIRRPVRKKSPSKYIRHHDDADALTDHYKSTNKWVLIVFSIIIVLLVSIIAYLIYEDKKKGIIQYKETIGCAHLRQHPALRPEYNDVRGQQPTAPVQQPVAQPVEQPGQQPVEQPGQQPVTPQIRHPIQPTKLRRTNRNIIEDDEEEMQDMLNMLTTKPMGDEYQEEIRNRLVNTVKNTAE